MIKSKTFPFLICVLGLSFSLKAQITATTSSTVNTNCNGVDCNYSGPSILINEVMMSPASFDGSLWSTDCSIGCGEWIELYNPDQCNPVDVSCFHLGNFITDNNAPIPGGYAGGFTIPSGTIIPARGFLVIRGQNAPAVNSNLLVQNGGKTIEIVVSSSNTCIGAGAARLWFPNAGGWFAFYDNNGVPQDAIAWGPSSTDLDGHPCVVNNGSCGINGTLASYNDIASSLKQVIYSTALPNSMGTSIRRPTDGGAWAVDVGATPTQGTCNGVCVPAPVITCTGTASVHPTNGVAPFTYQWNDSQSQTTQTATGLCAGNYTVSVTDQNGSTGQFAVTVLDYVPLVIVDLISDVCIDAGIMTLTGGSPVPSTGESGVYSGTGVYNSNFDPALAGSGTHGITYTYTDSFGCYNSASTDITVHDVPTISVNSDTICIGQEALLNATVSNSGGVFTWLPGGESTSSISPNPISTASYTVTYSLGGCSTSATGTVVVQSISAEISSSQTTINSGESIELSANNADSYDWNTGASEQSISVSPTENTTYCVVVSENGCIDSACITITIGCESVIYVPNCITANGDETNEVFTIKGDCLYEYHLLIFNRWGEQIFETFDILDSWDGRYKDKAVQEGVYTYVLYARGLDNDIKHLHGFVTVIR